MKPNKVRYIEVKLHDIAQLFNSLDPAPFNTKDLDQDAEEFIVNWAQEYPRDVPLCLRLHLDKPIPENEVAVINEAIHHYFAYRGELNQLEFRRLMRQGRISLAIGLAFLCACLAISHFILPGHLGRGEFLRESLTIPGWVAMWRPLEIYLYDWWPLQRLGVIYTKLSQMPVEIVAS